ncbi:uncharacterized protein F4807DRAFT_433017 [Annulohypoxylon truncatum]|uniref:uncharacterized protein n=1 Tax=Annulohypoxylon truncatum TaxID=327061 RepID=UPI002007E57B|nr:uncharacterized protein F4807DRAFT_433017 [Annulohypoxylon truncatum]KAI1208056.1 hypothetical protein F4807DRAFT_433017 [Annulohypoxylon truncatum]
MSDQDTKPVEGVKSPVENVAADVDNSTTEPDMPQTNGKAEPNVNVEKGEENKNNDLGPRDLDEDIIRPATQGDSNDTEDEAESKVDPKKRKWPQIRNPPKDMLKVNRGGCPTREKSDPSILPVSDDPKAIRWQVEFYFSDSNLPNDKFLWKKTDGSNNKPVPLSLICSFARMRRFKPYSAVVEALKTSSRLVLEGPEGEETIRRKEPCEPSDEMSRKIEDRTTYIKGFGEESKSAQFDIENFVSQFGEINAVRLRRDEEAKDKVFKGSIFVEWVDEETANKFYDLDPKPRYKDNPLMIMPKREYDRQTQLKDRRQFKNSGLSKGHLEQRENKLRAIRGIGRRGDRPTHDPDNWKKRREADKLEGFNDPRGRRERRGRARGNSRGRGRDRGQSSNDRAKEQESVPQDDGKPKVHTSKEGQKIIKEEQAKRDADTQTNGKRARDEDATTDSPPAKKADTKEAIANVA